MSEIPFGSESGGESFSSRERLVPGLEQGLIFQNNEAHGQDASENYVFGKTVVNLVADGVSQIARGVNSLYGLNAAKASVRWSFGEDLTVRTEPEIINKIMDHFKRVEFRISRLKTQEYDGRLYLPESMLSLVIVLDKGENWEIYSAVKGDSENAIHVPELYLNSKLGQNLAEYIELANDGLIPQPLFIRNGVEFHMIYPSNVPKFRVGFYMSKMVLPKNYRAVVYNMTDGFRDLTHSMSLDSRLFTLSYMTREILESETSGISTAAELFSGQLSYRLRDDATCQAIVLKPMYQEQGEST